MTHRSARKGRRLSRSHETIAIMSRRDAQERAQRQMPAHANKRRLAMCANAKRSVTGATKAIAWLCAHLRTVVTGAFGVSFGVRRGAFGVRRGAFAMRSGCVEIAHGGYDAACGLADPNRLLPLRQLERERMVGALLSRYLRQPRDPRSSPWS